ncbi:putative virion structural protein [Erwinia phage Wellington]|jgi:hypothetical protein|uniref:Putative virion structural protein n=2 Tax=Wellingtonvirus wellington TaxID=2734153 RepID=A0A1B2IDQ6_9CAUD|nr:putative virion structural protein [Erwinia phage vB_EamM_Kwan]YP_009806549.1 putative virion structural protein [Erwinia phage Wellington]ANZ49417.1 putative virion structural protein [Erwinia phage vB_EamM_Kwan]AXF51195.1 putative virion structural protein [Erwinia phage Wellington]
MPIPNMLAMLLPSFESINLKNQLSSNCDAIGEALLPRFQTLQEVVGTQEGKHFKNSTVQEMSEDIVSSLRSSSLNVKGLRVASMLEYIIPSLENVLTLRSFLEQHITKDIGKSLVTSALTFNKQTLLQMLDIIDFATKYSSVLLNYVTAVELNAVEGSNIDGGAIAPNDLQYLKTQSTVFCIALRVLGTPINKLKADYAEIPEAIFDEDTYNDLVASFGSGTTDPLGMRSVPFPLTIVYRVRLNFAEWQMDRYDECVAAGKAAELRILLWKKQQAEGSGDAAIERLIKDQEKRLMDLKYKREKLEKKYGLQ